MDRHDTTGTPSRRAGGVGPWANLLSRFGSRFGSRGGRHPLEVRSMRGALEAMGAVGIAAGLAGSVRLLPWLLDPAVTYRIAAPFARGILILACETSILVGWPLGWALGSVRHVEAGERRALATLGESPVRALLRLAPYAAVLGSLLAVASFIGGREASAPGRAVTDLIARGRESCAEAPRAVTYAVPFVGLTWLCSPGLPPRLVGRGPGALSNAMFTALAARAAGDLRAIDLDDARFHLDAGVDVHVRGLRLRGLSPFAHASSVPPVARAVALAMAGGVAAAASVLGVLSGALRGRLAAMVVAMSGSLTALGGMRWLERGGGGWLPTMLIPVLSLAVALAVMSALLRLRDRTWAAS